MKFLFVINPVSGGKPKDDLLDLIGTASREHAFDFKIYNTSGENDSRQIAEQMNEFEPDRVVVAGGDGTIQLVAQHFITIRKQVTLGLLPLGSANGLATSLGLSQNISENLNTAIHSANVVPVDLLLINKKQVCVHLCDVGANALLVKYYSEEESRGMMGYAKHIIQSIQESSLLHFTIDTPQGFFERDGLMLAFSNAHKYGTGVHISDGSVSDGLFEISNVQKLDLETAIKAGLTIFNIFIDKDMFSDVIRSTYAAVHIQPEAHFHVDGEYMGKTGHLEIELLPSAVNVVLPHEA